jgi:hypothetical protein
VFRALWHLGRRLSTSRKACAMGWNVLDASKNPCTSIAPALLRGAIYCGCKSCVDGAEFAMRSEEERAPQSASRTMKTAKQTHRVIHKPYSPNDLARLTGTGIEKQTQSKSTRFGEAVVPRSVRSYFRGRARNDRWYRVFTHIHALTVKTA